MFAYMIAEWRDWLNGQMAKTIVSGVVIIAIIGAFVSIQPFVMMIAVCVESIWLGWYLGNRYWRGSLPRSRFLYDRLSSLQAVAGKIGAAVMIASVHALSMAPLFILIAVIWGVSAGGIFVCLAICFSSFLIALGFGFFFSLAISVGEGVLGTLFMCLWLVLSGVLAPARIANPFVQIWLCMNKSRALSIYLCAPILLAVTCALFSLSIPLLKRLRMDSHE